MAEHEQTASYRVLARKYRPAGFAELIGQDAMVRTLRNAIASGRLAHAFILTGVRGVGKTTTARIIARALNCIGPDGKGGPTVEPCGACEHCRAIAEDRHVDVIEMDAASRTGIDDVRELIEGVRYRPVSARYKIYIIDEVHMLSKPAFNALLKTLEEPPGHVKFIFATTEVRRVPVTVLSRCQRFDLRRVDPALLEAHLTEVARREGVAVEAEALSLIARAADGSVRDGLSLLDTAIAHGAESGGGIAAAEVRDMMGLADRTRVLDLFDGLMAGEVGPALEVLDELYGAGADPAVVLQDLLEFCHALTRLKIAPAEAEGPEAGQAERARGREMARKLSVPTLARAWQMLLKGLSEVHAAPSPIAAAEMALVRLAYAADLPPPAELVRDLGGAGTEADAPADRGGEAGGAEPGHGGGRGTYAARDTGAAAELAPRAAEIAGGPAGGERPQAVLAGARAGAEPALCEPLPEAEPVAAPDPEPGLAEAEGAAAPEPAPEPGSFEEVVALFAERREPILHAHLMGDVHLVRFEPGRIEFRPAPGAPANLANRLGELLHRWTRRRWVVSVSRHEGAPTLKQQADEAAARLRREAAADAAVRAVLDAFPGATIEAVRNRPRGAPPSRGPRSDEGDDAP